VVELLERRSFVGRGTELARLRELFGSVVGGAGRVAIVGGEAGIGKTWFVAQFVDEVDSSARVLEGACLPIAAGGLPYAPFVEILRELVRETPPERLPALLGPGRDELSRLLPELAIRAADVLAPSDPDRASQGRLFEIVLAVFQRLAAAGPLVICIEDVQWADQATRELIEFLVRTLRDERVLFVLTTRTDESGSVADHSTFLAELEREDNVERLELRPFDRTELAAQVGALLDDVPDPTVLDQLLSRTDGNPFFVEELLLAGAMTDTALPPVLRDVLAARISKLPAPTRDVLRAAAAAGRRIDDELLASVMDIPPRKLADALREAVESGILVRQDTDEGSVSMFRHALLQEVVDGELFPGERVALHGAFARALEARAAAGDRQISPGEIARHWDQAREPARALAPTVEAASAAERACAFPEALRLWRRGISMVRTVPDGESLAGMDLAEMQASAADCAVLSGEFSAALELGRAAIAAVDPAQDAARAGTLQDRLRWYLWESGDRAGAAEAVAEALRLLPVDPPSRARAGALAQSAGINLYAGAFERSTIEAREAIEIARQIDAPGELALALGALGWSLAALGDVEAGIETFREGQRIAESIGSAEGAALAATNLAALLDRVGHAAGSLTAARTGYELTERLGLARTYGGLLLGYQAKAELVLGLWDDADRSTALGLREASSDLASLWLLINRARLLIGRGRDAEAEVLLRRARVLDERLGETEFRTALVAGEAELEVYRERIDVVRGIADQGLSLAGRGGPPDPSLAWLSALVMRAEADEAERLRAGGRSASAGEPGENAVEPRLARIEAEVAAAIASIGRLATTPGSRAHALVQLILAERGRLAGRSDPEAWSALVGEWSALGRPYQVAYAQYRHAEAVLGSRGPREVAAAALRSSEATTSGLGALPLREAVRRLARQARIEIEPAAGREQPDTAFDLTPREAEVLRLVASGWTNQQIADALFITRKTASVHVSNILAKLGVSRRAEAGAVAHRVGLAGESLFPPVGSG
jgi:DNA-binding CsgD family transcriptional regulator/tetratricopeptide (TPR) repeat protein